MIKRRNMVVQVLLFIITFGIYGVYWFYVTSKEMVEYKKAEILKPNEYLKRISAPASS